FPHDQLFSLDQFRRLLTSGDVLDMGATPSAVAMLHELVGFRMATGRTTVIDSTNVDADRREHLAGIAAAAGRPVVAVMMHTSREQCLERNAARVAGAGPYPGANDLPVPPEVIDD